MKSVIIKVQLYNSLQYLVDIECISFKLYLCIQILTNRLADRVLSHSINKIITLVNNFTTNYDS